MFIMTKIEIIKKIVNILIYITLISFIVLTFAVFQLPSVFGFLVRHFWLMFSFPLLAAWFVFARNRLIEYINQASQAKNELPASGADKDNQ